MANRLQLKRGTGAPGSIFYEGEPIFDLGNKALYVGDTGATGTGAGTSIASAETFLASLQILSRATTSNAGAINLYEDADNGTNKVQLIAPATLSGDVVLTLPTNDGDNGQLLKTDGSGNLSFATPFSIGADTGTADSILVGDTVTFSGGEGIDTAVTDGTITISAEIASSTNAGISSFNATDFTVAAGGAVTLNAERVEDIVGVQLVTNGSHTLISASYDDAGDGAIDLTVNDDLSLYDNTTSAFITASSSDSLTNKTFDANGTGNSISNLEVADFAASGITTSGDTIASNDSDAQLPTSAAVIDYVGTQIGNIDLTIDTSADSGTGSVSTSQTFTISGTANEIETSASNQTITIGLPNNVTIGNNLSVTNDLTVSGNLRVVGTAVTFEAQTVRIEDRLLELGLISNAEPTAETTWDTGLVFNWHNGTAAKKSALFWFNNQFITAASDITEVAGSGTADPQITVNSYAPIVSAGLYVGGITAGDQVINSSKEAVNLVFDGGTYS